jgi:DNA-binding response OmpR family regulator
VGDLVVIVDPEGIERRYVASILAGEGHDITQVQSPIQGIVAAMRQGDARAVMVLAEETDPVSIDDCIRVIRRLTGMPLLVIGRDSSLELDSLHSGADDYIPRPFSASGLIARVRMLSRRAGGLAGPEQAGSAPPPGSAPPHGSQQERGRP